MANKASNSSILVFPLDSLNDAPKFKAAVRTATDQSNSAITIIAFSNLFDKDSDLSHTGSWDAIHSVLSLYYVEATRVAQAAGNILLRIDVLLKGWRSDVELPSGVHYNRIFRIDGDERNYPLPDWTETLLTTILPVDHTHDKHHHPVLEHVYDSNNPYPSTYPVAALGGTFDHLHPGHKILLSMAAWIAHEKVIVGISDDVLLQRKANKELLESIDIRIGHVRSFLKLFKPGLVYDVVPIHDVYGPTAVDPNIQALIVSKETVKGASAIASYREQKELPPLRCFVIEVISADPVEPDSDDMDMDALMKAKLSSTFIRQWIAKNRPGAAIHNDKV